MSYSTLDRQTGTGALYLSGERLARVRYLVEARREVFMSRLLREPPEATGPVEFHGNIIVSWEDRGKPAVLEAVQSCEVMTLSLEKPFFDGRQWLQVHLRYLGVPPMNATYDFYGRK